MHALKLLRLDGASYIANIGRTRRLCTQFDEILLHIHSCGALQTWFYLFIVSANGYKVEQRMKAFRTRDGIFF